MFSNTISKSNRRQQKIIELIRQKAKPLQGSDHLDPLMHRIGDARIVLLGEASHGTHEYYTWRAQITKRPIREKGFNFIAVEGDWPDCYSINRYIKHYVPGKKAADVLHAFKRWPTWMWANREIAALAELLHSYNNPLPNNKKIGFYGLDVYSLWDSMEAIKRYLEKVDPGTLKMANEAFECFEPYKKMMAHRMLMQAAWFLNCAKLKYSSCLNKYSKECLLMIVIMRWPLVLNKTHWWQ